jgi:hypothetical protein
MVRYNHPCAFPDKQLCRGGADSGRRTRHDSYFSFESHFLFSQD